MHWTSTDRSIIVHRLIFHPKWRNRRLPSESDMLHGQIDASVQHATSPTIPPKLPIYLGSIWIQSNCAAALNCESGTVVAGAGNSHPKSITGYFWRMMHLAWGPTNAHPHRSDGGSLAAMYCPIQPESVDCATKCPIRLPMYFYWSDKSANTHKRSTKLLFIAKFRREYFMSECFLCTYLQSTKNIVQIMATINVERIRFAYINCRVSGTCG